MEQPRRCFSTTRGTLGLGLGGFLRASAVAVRALLRCPHDVRRRILAELHCHDHPKQSVHDILIGRVTRQDRVHLVKRQQCHRRKDRPNIAWYLARLVQSRLAAGQTTILPFLNRRANGLEIHAIGVGVDAGAEVPQEKQVVVPPFVQRLSEPAPRALRFVSRTNARRRR